MVSLNKFSRRLLVLEIKMRSQFRLIWRLWRIWSFFVFQDQNFFIFFSAIPRTFIINFICYPSLDLEMSLTWGSVAANNTKVCGGGLSWVSGVIIHSSNITVTATVTANIITTTRAIVHMLLLLLLCGSNSSGKTTALQLLQSINPSGGPESAKIIFL